MKQARRTEAFLSLYRELLKVDTYYPIMMKGLICRQLYGEYCDHRPSGDEDILIRKAEYKQVQQIPQEIGYRPKY
ncbi:nucleotidyltransferase family protein [Holdemania filiformis]|uniref:nucleotidyltransferase family protein n=1 Tax=Holdemania filiformis TaxID=61171 RepID=UPI003A4E4A9E